MHFTSKARGGCIAARIDDGAGGTCAIIVAQPHGGSGAATAAIDQLTNTLRQFWSQSKSSSPKIPDRAVVSHMFEIAHARCARLTCRSGTSLTLAVVGSPSARRAPQGATQGCYPFVVANVGDVGAVVATPSSHAWYSTSHSLQDNAQERERVIERVTYIEGVDGPVGPPRLSPAGLRCSRSLGDSDTDAVVATPSVAFGELGPNDVLVVATEQVWRHAAPLSSLLSVVHRARSAEGLLCSTVPRRVPAAVAIAAPGPPLPAAPLEAPESPHDSEGSDSDSSLDDAT